MTDTNKKTIDKILGTTMYGPNYEEGLSLCKKNINSQDLWIRNASIEGLSHLARLHGQMDLGFAIPQLKTALEHEWKQLSGIADDVLDDFEIFLPDFKREDFDL